MKNKKITKVPLLDLFAQNDPLIPEIKEKLDKIIATHWYVLGPEVKEFEAKAGEYLGTEHAVGCASGSDALILALKALDIGTGDEVITTPFTFFATAGAISRVGAIPRFVDIDPKTYNIDPSLIEAAITPKTKAIMPVHLFGQAAEMDSIMEIAKKHGLKVIEDNAQGIGAKYKDKFAGLIGDIGTLSFFPSKNLGAMGDAGMCLTNNPELGAKLTQMRVHGENPKYYHKWVGLNSRIDTIQAAVLSVKIDYLANWSEQRRKNAKYYFENLKDVKEIVLPYIEDYNYSIFNQFTIAAQKRDELMAYLHKANIGCAIYYPLPLHLQECFADLGYKKGDFPVAEKAAEEVLSIPVYSELTNNQKDYVIEHIKSFYNTSA